MSRNRLPWSWGPAASDGAVLPCDDLIDGPTCVLDRSVEVDAEPATVFAWICQLRAAPYSYDLLDNLGRRSPRTRAPGLTDLAEGQLLMVFRVCQFERDVHVTGLMTRRAARVFGRQAVTYAVRAQEHHSLLRARLVISADSRTRAAVTAPFAWGDLVMMRKQLRTLADLAEREQRALRATNTAGSRAVR